MSRFVGSRFIGNGWAAVFVLTAMAIIGPNDTIVPLLKDDIGVGQFHLLRGIVAVPMIVAAAWWAGWSLRMHNPAAIIFRTLAFTLAMLAYFSSLSFLPIAVTGAGLFTAPIFVLLFSAVFFRQHIGIRRIVAVFIGSIGVVVILDPGSELFSWMNVLPVFGGAMLAASNVLTRRYCADEHPAVVLIASFIGLATCGAVASIVLSLYPAPPDSQFSSFIITGWGELTLKVAGLIVVQGVFASVAMWFLIRAYQIGDPTYINVFEYAFLIFAGLAGWVFLGQTLGGTDFAGIVLITAAGMIIALATRKEAQPMPIR